MSAIITTKKLIEQHLNTLTPSFPIAWENVAFTPPSNGSKYLRCVLTFNQPDDTCIDDVYYRERAEFRIYVLDKLNIGTTGALTTAESIRTLFGKRTTLEEGNTRVQVLKTPHVAGAIKAQDRLIIPITIELTVENL